MPITTLSNFADGLDPARRSREHFITNTNLNQDRPWVLTPMVSGFNPAASTLPQADSA
jgi:hypothetical protein